MAARTVTNVRRATETEAQFHTNSKDAFVLILETDMDDFVGAVTPLAFTKESLTQLIRLLCSSLKAKLVPETESK